MKTEEHICLKCEVAMESKIWFNSRTELLRDNRITIYQCPQCKNIEAEQSNTYGTHVC
jgi:hypothetical protein